MADDLRRRHRRQSEVTRRASLYRRNKNDNYRTRVEMLRAIQKPELIWDSTLISGLTPPRGFRDNDWGMNNKANGLDFNHVFKTLAKISSQKLGEERRIEMLKHTASDRFIVDYKTSIHPDDQQFLELDGQHPIQILSKKSTGEWAGLDKGPDENSLSSVKTLFRLINILTVMRRFADGRNPETRDKPLPDGSNLLEPDLRRSWVVHRAWIRLLHYRGFHRGLEPFGVEQLRYIMQSTFALYLEEVYNVAPDPVEKRVSYDEFRPIDDMLSLAREKIEAIADQMDKEGLWSVGIRSKDPARFSQIVWKNLGHTPEDYDFRLWSLLLNLNGDLEHKLRREHVEDVLINKRVVVEDEWCAVHDALIDENQYSANKFVSQLDRDYQNSIEPILSKIGQINCMRRNYLLLRNWNHKRPWKQLYHIFDTTDNGPERMYRESISDFYAYIHDIQQIKEPHLAEDSPSRKANIWTSLFPIHPIGLHGPEPLIPQLEDNCVICMDGFKADPEHPVIARLHCNHLFHFLCIRDYWDDPDKLQMKCPLCGPSSLCTLRSTAAITPEVADVWDNALVVGEQRAAANPNLSDLWADDQIHRMEMSYSWRHRHPNEMRVAAIEMATLRDVRWRVNRYRRADAKAQKKAFGI
ncbi:uncharacterized protein BP5553_07794 [Venustampulla echinocandica]|uniref:RING-type domain-containing protein n=1 Tax=Venustampulla echinocandica TaxID=2656787 RepID=A0A370THJ6_9HELO|nr:uncharacterized protein BP5553_07794 [Venustampulla echinocandica]RDL34666.1 hypothetical protein BP5553_07794 [Venustampulla echinocandica]